MKESEQIKSQKGSLKLPYPENLLYDIGLEKVFEDARYHELNDDQMKGLEYAISLLTGQEQGALRLRYQERMTYKEIGEDYKVSASRAGQVIQKALRRLRTPQKLIWYREGYDAALLLLEKESQKQPEAEKSEKAVPRHRKSSRQERPEDPYQRLRYGNWKYVRDSAPRTRTRLAVNGQHPYAIIICCSDSRVIPERVFTAGPGELFVIRVAGNVLDNHQIGSIEYAAGHLHCSLVVVLGHTGCGAVDAALKGGGEGYIKYITDDILRAIGDEKDPDKASFLNVEHSVKVLKEAFADHPEIHDVDIRGAVFDIMSGEVEWLGEEYEV